MAPGFRREHRFWSESPNHWSGGPDRRIQANQQSAEGVTYGPQAVFERRKGSGDREGQVADRCSEIDLKGDPRSAEVTRLAYTKLRQACDPVLDHRASPVNLGKGSSPLVSPMTPKLLGVRGDGHDPG
jgi:hypothetical protein